MVAETEGSVEGVDLGGEVYGAGPGVITQDIDKDNKLIIKIMVNIMISRLATGTIYVIPTHPPSLLLILKRQCTKPSGPFYLAVEGKIIKRDAEG